MTSPAFILGLPQRDATRLSLAAVERYEAGLIDGVMLSASSMWATRRRGPGRFVEPTCALDDVPLVIDSAGFVAASKWGGYPWSPEAYVEHIATMSHRPVWWSSMDLCCEPEVAEDAATVRHRIEETARLLARCRALAARWRDVDADTRASLAKYKWPSDSDETGQSATSETAEPDSFISGNISELWPQDPLPILQGWSPDDYLYSAELTDVVLTTRGLAGRWPDLVGLGSVCRRRLQGEDGLLAIVSRLDRVLPTHVQLHLYGVHSEAVEPLIAAYGHRLASYDSQAWGQGARHDAQARRRKVSEQLGREVQPGDPEWVPCDVELKLEHIDRFATAQAEARVPTQLDLLGGLHG